MADKVLLVACFLVLGTLSLIPIWLVVAAVFRDLLITGGALLYNFRIEELEATPIAASKVNTVLQILLVVLVMANAGPLPLPDWVIATLVWACLGSVVVSGAQYVWIWGRKARRRGSWTTEVPAPACPVSAFLAPEVTGQGLQRNPQAQAQGLGAPVQGSRV